jgi:hypothetical protein
VHIATECSKASKDTPLGHGTQSQRKVETITVGLETGSQVHSAWGLEVSRSLSAKRSLVHLWTLSMHGEQDDVCHGIIARDQAHARRTVCEHCNLLQYSMAAFGALCSLSEKSGLVWVGWYPTNSRPYSLRGARRGGQNNKFRPKKAMRSAGRTLAPTLALPATVRYM